MACYSKWDPGNCGCSCTLQVEVLGCNSMATAAGLTVDLKVSGSTIYTGTTNASGIAAISGTAGTYDVVVTDGRTPSRWTTQTFTGKSLTCGGTTTVTLTTPQSTFVCVPACGEPVSKTLSATDPNGTWTLSWISGQIWRGCASKASMANIITSVNAGCIGTIGTGTAPYVISLDWTLATPIAYNNVGTFTAPGPRTSGTPTCSGGSLNLNAGLVPLCVGVVKPDLGNATGVAYACPLSLSVTGTMPANTGLGSVNPGSGAFTITE